MAECMHVVVANEKKKYKKETKFTKKSSENKGNMHLLKTTKKNGHRSSTIFILEKEANSLTIETHKAIEA